MYSSGEVRCADSGSPRFRKKSPNALEKTTITVQIQVLSRRRAVSDVMRRALIAGIGGNGRSLGSLLFGHELLPFGAQRHVFPSFLGEPAALVGVEDGLPDDAPHHARAEEILAVEPLHELHQFAAVQTRVHHVGPDSYTHLTLPTNR